MIKKLRKLFTNSAGKNPRVMVQCRTAVKKDAVRRESIDGIEHIIVSSSTLPDDVVMNGIMYPADEVEKSFETLELTLAPVEHPSINGQFIPASDPRAIHEFHAGAFNMNVRRENGRVHIDKYINVAEALKSDRGKRLLDRIEELENNSEARPIHTSVGVFVTVDELDEPQTNADGDEYSLVASDMYFDHDAILLDSVGAAQPSQGVGVGVNKSGEECDINVCSVDGDNSDDDPVRVVANQSHSETYRSVSDALEKSAIDADWIDELFEDRVIFWSKDQLFEVPYTTDSDGVSTIVGIPLPVERTVTFTPKTNTKEGNAMKDLILNALKKAGIETDKMSDDQLLEAYNKLDANVSVDAPAVTDDEAGIASVIANAIKPLTDKIDGLEAKLNSAETTEIDSLSDIVANSGKYPGLDADSAKLLGVDTLKQMAGNCKSAFGLSPVVNSGGSDEGLSAPTDMPE